VSEKFGGRADTIVSTGALADFILSCSSTRSRNYNHGLHLARGDARPDALAEGRHSAESFVTVLKAQQIQSTYFETIAAALANPRLIGGSLT
ncbi:MAG: NAD(P)H-dependent glycerol-3-phosphate dehydrogenase, partial [Chloroflexota bacterium]